MFDQHHLISTARLDVVPLTLIDLRLYITDYRAFCKKS